MVLEGPGVELLRVIRHRDGEHIASCGFADEPAQSFKSRVGAAEMHIEAQGGSVAVDRRRVDLERECFLVPVLSADVVELRAAANHEVVDATGESGAVAMDRAEMLDHGDL